MTRRKADHVVLDNDFGHFACRRCGETYVPTLPASLTMMVAMMRAFAQDHGRCKEKR